MAYYIKSTTIRRGNPHATILREIAYSEDTGQTVIKTKLVGKLEVKCFEEVFDGDTEEETYAEYMLEGDWENITADEFNVKECTSFEEINDENRGIVTKSKKLS
jgi:hypothetical protein